MNKKLAVMLIDDNKLDLYLFHQFIKYWAISKSVSTFTYAGDALLYLHENEEVNWPDLILLDIQMPEMDGFEFLERYEQLPLSCRQKCSIVMVSSSLDFADLTRARANTLVLGVLEKPLNMRELIQLLGENSIL